MKNKLKVEMVGRKFGALTVISAGALTKRPNGAIDPQWICVCDCGSQKTASGGHLRSGHTTSCGCLKGLRRHGFAGTPTYLAWIAMKERCLNPRHSSYASYGARGIKVCDRWLEFPNFLADMGERPPGRMTVERLNNEAGYEPANCKWATYSEQSKNRGMQKRNKSGFAGVCEVGSRWYARITVDHKQMFLGSFRTLQEAVKVRREAARRFGFKTDIGEELTGIRHE